MTQPSAIPPFPTDEDEDSHFDTLYHDLVAALKEEDRLRAEGRQAELADLKGRIHAMRARLAAKRVRPDSSDPLADL